MEHGLAIIEMNDTEAKAVFIDRETLEFARQNAKTAKRIANAEAKHRHLVRKFKAEKRANDRQKAYNIESAKRILFHGSVIGGMVYGCMVGLIHPIISVPVALVSLCATCLRLGAWFGRGSK
jgi:hypothetical protein